MFTVTLTGCVAGNPLKAWKGTTGEDDLEHVPDDVWEDQTHDFADLDAAKDFIRGLHPDTSTHVLLLADGVVIFDQDAGADHLDDAASGVTMPHLVDSGGGSEDAVPDAPPLLASQGGQ